MQIPSTTPYMINKGYKFCPKCAGKLKYQSFDSAQHPVCQKCGFIFFQNSKPTAGAVIEDGKGRVLLHKRAESPRRGYWDILGGFLNNGEDPIVGLKREMKEELGVNIKVGDLVGIYTDSYMRDEAIKNYTLNIQYKVRLKTNSLKPNQEIAELKWFSENEVPWNKLAFKSQHLILKDYFRQYKDDKKRKTGKSSQIS